MARKKPSTWKEQRHTIEQRRDAVSTLEAQYKNEEDVALCKLLQELKEEKERLENEQQLISERMEAIGQVLSDRWSEAGYSSLDVDGVGTFSINLRLFVSTKDKEAYHQWLKDNDMEVLIQPTVAPKTTESLVRERIEQGLPVDQMGLTVNYKSLVK
jgi:hypothetical protein